MGLVSIPETGGGYRDISFNHLDPHGNPVAPINAKTTTYYTPLTKSLKLSDKRINKLGDALSKAQAKVENMTKGLKSLLSTNT